MPPRTQRALAEEISRSLRHVRIRAWIAVVYLTIMISPAFAAAADWTPLTERLVADGFNRQAMETLFARPEVLYEPEAMAGKLKELIRSRTSEAASLAAALRKSFYRNYLTRIAIADARSYLIENKAILEEVSAKYGVPKEIIVSILLVETRLGRSTGNRCVFNRLASMALCTDLETLRPSLDASLITPDTEEFARNRLREKSDWAYRELRALLLLGRAGRHRPARNPGIHIRGDRPVSVHAYQRYCLRRGRRSGRPHRSLCQTRRPPQHRELSSWTRLARRTGSRRPAAGHLRLQPQHGLRRHHPRRGG